MSTHLKHPERVGAFTLCGKGGVRLRMVKIKNVTCKTCKKIIEAEQIKET